MDSLKSVQITNEAIIKGIVRQLERMKKSESLPDQVRLRVSLNGEHWYAVQLHWEAAQSLMLNVLSTTDGD